MTIADLSKLSDEELNVRLAELRGWTFKRGGGFLAILDPAGIYQGGASDYDPDQLKTAMGNAHAPRYTTDLNAVAAVEAGLTDEQWDQYEKALKVICKVPPAHRSHRGFLNASPRQRTEAIIATLTP